MSARERHQDKKTQNQLDQYRYRYHYLAHLTVPADLSPVAVSAVSVVQVRC